MNQLEKTSYLFDVRLQGTEETSRFHVFGDQTLPMEDEQGQTLLQGPQVRVEGLGIACGFTTQEQSSKIQWKKKNKTDTSTK